VDHPEFDPEMIAEHAVRVFDARNVMRATSYSGEVL
jgi:hypothetical protein